MGNHRFWKNHTVQVAILFGLFLLLFLLYQYHRILFFRPESIHQWRQTVCTSIILNYYQNGMNFFRPEVHHFFSDGGTSGRSIAELPVLYYFNAILWKIFGAKEFIPRIVNIGICMLGSFYLFKMLRDILSPAWAILINIFLFTSPVVAFYSFGFMVDIPALYICFISAYYFFRYYESGEAKSIYAFMLLSALTLLLKVTVGIFFLSVIGVFVLEKSKIVKFKHTIFRKPLRDGLLFAGVLAVVGGWYSYARHFDTIHGGWYTINDIFPIWDTDEAGRENILKAFFDGIVFQFFYPPAIFIFFLLLGLVVLSFRKIEKIYFSLTMLLTFGSLAYALLWFKVWDVHDYYVFLFLLPVVFIFISAGHYLKNNFEGIFYSWKTKGLFIFFLLINIWYCSNNIRLRYGISSSDIPVLTTRSEIELWRWFDWNYGNTIKAFETIEPYNRSIGIKPEDLVISLPDLSICITLYLMNQKGWTEGGEFFYDRDDIGEKIKLGAKYLMLNDSTHATKPFINPYTKSKVGQYKNVVIYDLRPYAARNN